MNKTFFPHVALLLLLSSFQLQASTFFSLPQDAVTTKQLAKNANVYELADSMPTYQGGDSALFAFIATNIQYPASAIKNKQQGKVYLRFVINKDGETANVQILKSVNPALDQEALRVFNLLNH